MAVAVSEHVYPTISDDDVASYRENGFLVVPNALNEDEIEELRADTVALCRGDWGEVGKLPEHGPGDSNEDIIGRVLCIHQIHKISPVTHRYLAQQTMAAVLTRIIGPNVKCMQSMLFIKAAGKPGQAWHQDEIYIPTRDRTLTGGWIALDDATTENGCLYVIPGSHAPGILYPQRDHGDLQFDGAQESYQFPYSDDEAIPVEVEAGTIVFFNGYLLHRSFPNHAKLGFRRVLVNHYMSAESLLPWRHAEGSGGVARADYRDIVMIAGEDPYAWKGIEDHARPGVRSVGDHHNPEQ